MINQLHKKPKVLFVGAFKQTLDGAVGGQLHACKTLINSPINNKVDFTLIDSTMETLPPPPLVRRAYLALKRILVFFYRLSTIRYDSTFIFTGAGFGFVEKGCMVLLAKIFRVRIVLGPRSGLLVDQISRRRLMRWYVNFILHQCDVVLCQSQSWKEFYQELTKLPSQRFVIIKNWINPLPYLALPIQKNHCDQINVLFLGWIEINKGIYDLVLAVKENQKLLSNYTFIVCGKGSEMEGVQSVISEYGLNHFFEFRGWVVGEKKMSVLRDADILVMPSYREGLPNSLLEAMASGCAVIASSVGAIPDVISDRKNGILVPRGDKVQLANSLILLGSSYQFRKKMGGLARETILNQHDINNLWKGVFNLLIK
jgi:glycosyltransferase involved in cell wall biosynthesis